MKLLGLRVLHFLEKLCLTWPIAEMKFGMLHFDHFNIEQFQSRLHDQDSLTILHL